MLGICIYRVNWLVIYEHTNESSGLIKFEQCRNQLSDSWPFKYSVLRGAANDKASKHTSWIFTITLITITSFVLIQTEQILVQNMLSLQTKMAWMLKSKFYSGHYADVLGNINRSGLNECILVFLRLMLWLVLSSWLVWVVAYHGAGYDITFQRSNLLMVFSSTSINSL